MHTSIRATFKRRFLAGLLISIPAIVTFLIIGWFFRFVDAFSPESKVTSFKKFVLVEYPRSGVYAYGFLTKECTMRTEKDGQEVALTAVYIPTNLIYFGEIALFREENMFY